MYNLRRSARGTQVAEDGQRQRRPRVGRPERPLDPADGPLSRFASELRQLRAAAGYPSYRVLARTALFSASVLSTAASGSSFPTLQVTLAYASACGADAAQWRVRWETAAAELEMQQAAARAAGLPSPYVSRAVRSAHFGSRTRAAGWLASEAL
jgi:hypothetical protein